jgi:HEAT repeat protein
MISIFRKFLFILFCAGCLTSFLTAQAFSLHLPSGEKTVILAQQRGQDFIFVDETSPSADLFEALHQSTLKYQRRYAAQILGERKEPAAVPHLLRALQDPEDVVQRAAAEALVKIKDTSIFPSLIANLNAERPSLRQYSAYILGQLATKENKSVVQALEKLSADKESSVRLEVIYALYRIGSPSSAPIFTGGLVDDEPRIRSYCANALGNLKLPDAGESLKAALEGEEDADVRRSIIFAMGQIGGSSSARVLAEAAMGESPSLRADIADALAEIKTPEATRTLTEMLSDPAPTVRARAAAALINVKDSTAAGPLAKALEDRSVLVRRPASEALIYAADASVIDELVKALGDSDSVVADNAARALIAVNDLDAVNPLIKALEEQTKKVRALHVLEELTHRPYGDDITKWVQWYEENFKIENPTSGVPRAASSE